MTKPVNFQRGTKLRHCMLALCLLGAALPASAVIVLYAGDDTYLMANSPHYVARMPRGSSLTAISASTSPQLSYNLRRAHAWSRSGGRDTWDLPASSVLVVNPRPTSIEANLARARAFRDN